MSDRSPYLPAVIERLARTLYNATRGPESVQWAKLTTDTRAVWESLAIAALDMAQGARQRMTP